MTGVQTCALPISVREICERGVWNFRMVCDVDVDVGRRMVFGSEERREQMEKQRRKREKRTEIMRERREKFRGEKWNNFFFFFTILL